MRNYGFSTVLKDGRELENYEVEAEDILGAMLAYKRALAHEESLFVSYNQLKEATVEESYPEGGFDSPEDWVDVVLMDAEDWNGKSTTLCVEVREYAEA